MKIDLAEIHQGASEFANTRIAELEKEIQRQIDEKNNFETRLEEVSREPGIYIYLRHVIYSIISLQTSLFPLLLPFDVYWDFFYFYFFN